MNKILSWKINNASYAYIFPTNGTYISNAISEDSPLWANIIGELSTWTLDTYKSNFNKMAAEVKSKFGIVIPWKDEYWDLGIDGSINGVNIVLLSGKGGDGGYSGDSEINDEVYEEFNKMIDAELQKAREEIEKKNAEVKAFVETKVTETISAAKQTIAETKAEIDETRNELEGKLASATEALDKAAALFEMGEGGIDGEAIKDVMNSVSAHTTWFNTYSGTVADFQTDYDIAKQILGEMTVASSATEGLFSRFATSMNVVSGTVGSVERTMNAAYGEIKDVAEWINTNKDSVANVSRFMSASAALIEDKVKYIDNELTSVIERTVDGKNATIRDEIKAETASGLTNVRNEMNALSGSILQELTHYAPDSAITSIGNRMDALNTTMSEWMTKTDSAMSMTHDLREEWSIESGKISTVSNLVAKTDANGEIEYWVSGTTGEEIRVSRTENGSWVDSSGNFYNDNRVYVHYSDTLGSYIQQEVSAISMSVMGKDNVTAAIQLAVKEDAENGGEAIINMVANKVVIDATVIANAISAKTANIGGIVIGNGIIYATACDSYGNQAFCLNGQTGKITAFDAEIHGDIVAKSLKLQNQSIDEYITNKTISQDDINSTIQSFVKSSEFTDIVKNQGVITQEYFNNWAAKNNLTEEQVKKISNEIVGAEINQAGRITPNDDGSFTHTVKIGKDEYTWKTRDLGDYLLLGNQVSGNTSNGKASFIISRDGLLEAENAVIYGKVYASEGYFNGAVTATTLTIGQKPVSDVINDSIDDKTQNFATKDDIPTSENINKIIDDFTKTTAFTEMIKDGVVTKEEMEAAFKASGFTDEKAEELASKIDVPIVSHSKNADGSVTHTLTNSDGSVTSWTTYDAGDYVILGKGQGEKGGKYTMIDKDGLLTADNAIIHGTIYAQAGEFNGAITATSLTLGNGQGIDDYVNDKIPTDLTNESKVNELIGAFVGTDEFKNSITDGYITQDALDEWAKSQTGLTEEQVQEMINNYAGAEVNIPLGVEDLEDGGKRHSIKIGDETYSWDTYDAGGYLLLDKKCSGKTDDGIYTSTLISKNGLLQANNAIIYGEVHAQRGRIGQLLLSDGALSGSTFYLSRDGLVINGSIRQPFFECYAEENENSCGMGFIVEDFCWDDNGEQEAEKEQLIAQLKKNLNFCDNLYLPKGGTIPPLTCDMSQCGRRVVLVNNKGGRNVTNYGISDMTLPNGYYFFEDGFASNTLRFSNEVIELIGYGSSTSDGDDRFFGWIVLGRTSIMTSKLYGHELRALCSGRVDTKTGTISRLVTCDNTKYISSSETQNSTITSKYWNSTSFGFISSKKGNIPNEFYIRIPDKWFNGGSSNNVLVQVTPTDNATAWCGHHSSSGFTISASKDTYVDFILYNTGDWMCLPPRFNVDMYPDRTRVYFRTSDYGSSCAIKVTFTKEPENAVIKMGTPTYLSGHGEAAFKYSFSNDVFTVYPIYSNPQQDESFNITFTMTYEGETRKSTITIIQEEYIPPCIDYGWNQT